MIQAAPGSSQRRRSRSGIVLVLGIFVFGGALLLMLYKAPRTTDLAPASASWGVPDAKIVVVSVDPRIPADSAPAIRDTVRKADANIVFVQNISIEDIERIGSAIGMSRTGGAVYYPAQNVGGPSAPFGNAIYSTFPLCESRSIPSPEGSFGVWATVVVGDQKFVVASITTSKEHAKELAMLRKAWSELGSPPMLLGALELDRADFPRDSMLQPSPSSLPRLLTSAQWQLSELESTGLDAEVAAISGPAPASAPTSKP